MNEKRLQTQQNLGYYTSQEVEAYVAECRKSGIAPD